MSCTELLKKELKKEFPNIDKDLQVYVEGKNKIIEISKICSF